MAFCWSGQKIFLPTREGSVRVLSYPELEPVLQHNFEVDPTESTEFLLKGHTAPCLTAELSPTGRYLATGGADSIITLFDTKDWICQRTVSSMVGPVKNISMVIACPELTMPVADMIVGFTFDGCYVVGGCEEGTKFPAPKLDSVKMLTSPGAGLDVTHTETGDLVHTFKTAGPCEVVAWAPTRYCLAYSDLGILRIVGIDADRI